MRNFKETEKLEVGSGTEEQQLQAAVAEAENEKLLKLSRSRSKMPSSDNLEFIPEIQLKPTCHISLLFEDIQNFYQMNPASFSLPSCVTKAHSISQAVADLNSSAASNISGTLSDDKRAQPHPLNQFGSNCLADPFVKSEVGVRV